MTKAGGEGVDTYIMLILCVSLVFVLSAVREESWNCIKAINTAVILCFNAAVLLKSGLNVVLHVY